MAITVAIEHRTSYRFDRAVKAGPHVVRLRPAPHCRTPISSYALHIEPEDHFLNWMQDPFGNFEARLVFPEPIDHLTITVGIVADLTVVNPFDFFIDEAAEHFPFAYDSSLAHDLTPYLVTEPTGPLLESWLDTVRVPSGETPHHRSSRRAQPPDAEGHRVHDAPGTRRAVH
jgi:transglutaminase-like putative cysteine protease